MRNPKLTAMQQLSDRINASIRKTNYEMGLADNDRPIGSSPFHAPYSVFKPGDNDDNVELLDTHLPIGLPRSTKAVCGIEVTRRLNAVNTVGGDGWH